MVLAKLLKLGRCLVVVTSLIVGFFEKEVSIKGTFSLADFIVKGELEND